MWYDVLFNASAYVRFSRVLSWSLFGSAPDIVREAVEDNLEDGPAVLACLVPFQVGLGFDRIKCSGRLATRGPITTKPILGACVMRVSA